MTDTFLLFLEREGGVAGWLMLEGGTVIARGPRLEGLPARDENSQWVAIVPGDMVTFHWADLPAGLAPAQAAAAARLLVADYSAQPLDQVHIAVGRESESGPRCIALTSASAMTLWLAALAAEGLDPDMFLAEPLLLPASEDGVSRFDRDAISLYRGATEAFALEPGLADLVLAGRPVTTIDREAFESGLSLAVEQPLLDLRQGPFARRRQWRTDGKLLRRLVLLASALLLMTLAIQLVAIMRYTFAADRVEAEAVKVAATALPRVAGVTDASTQLRGRLTELRGGGVGFSAIISASFAALEETPNVQLSALAFSGDGSLRMTIQADLPATIEALVQRIELAGFSVRSGVLRNVDGRQVSEVQVKPK